MSHEHSFFATRLVVQLSIVATILCDSVYSAEVPHFVGEWTYRSYRNETDMEVPCNEIQFGIGLLEIDEVVNGSLQGQLDFGDDYSLSLKGSVEFGSPAVLRFRGVGNQLATRDWVYDYIGYRIPTWAHGVDQVEAIVGSVIRSRPHSEGRAQAGVVASWIAVRREEGNDSAGQLSELEESVAPHRANSSLTREAEAVVDEPLRIPWTSYLNRSTERRTFAAHLPSPQRLDAVLQSSEALADPEENTIRSVGRRLDVTLDVRYADNMIGDDPVRLRSYNGKLVGPTLRAKAGDTLHILLKNSLPDESGTTHGNGHHGWNTTNLHTHGLHVAPQGTPDAESDNVLLKLFPNEEQKYEIKIPANHVAGTFWYHAHKHGAVSAQVSSGMSGALIIERDEGSMAEVEEIANAKEQVLVFQQVPYLMRDGIGDIELRTPADLRRMFGPNQWHSMGRYTTVNGQVVPVIKMKPGEVQRWRMVHSGVREVLRLQLQSISDDRPEFVPFHEIAVDGLPLGKVSTKNEVELWPGYRSDALVKAPAREGRYVLVDATSPAENALEGQEEPLKYVARLDVAGTPVQMRLPSSDALSSYRLPSISASEVDGLQEAFYGITSAGFVIDGEEYDPNSSRELQLGKTEQWTIGTRNAPGIGAVHPFHIHVNPFEVFSILDRSNREILREPIWRDTIAMPQGYTIKFRTRYETFTGAFVHHCHVLDHEDQGMMELVEINDPNARESIGRAAAAMEATALLTDRNESNRPTVAVFILGLQCSHCAKQLQTLVREMHLDDVNLVCVSARPYDNPAFILKPMVLINDPDLIWFKRFGCYADGPMHGTVLFDGKGQVKWKTIGEEPFEDYPLLREKLGTLVNR